MASTYNKPDIVQALHAAGLQKGDTAYFSTSLGMMGVAEGVSTQDDLNSLFLEAITEAIGNNGTIIIPTYSYTIGKGNMDSPAIFDPKTTPAETGPFPNFFLQQKSVIRSEDPMMSMAALGPKAQELFKELPQTSYGADSVYARLANMPNTKAVSLGLGPNWTPFIHHADWLSKVPFRYDKLFYGGIKKPSSEIEYKYWVYAVPARIPESYADAHKLGKLATEAGIWSYHPLGRARVYVSGYKTLFSFTMKLMKDNKWLMARGPECDVLAREQARMTPPISTPFKDKMTGIELIEYLQELPRNIIGTGIDFIFSYLQKYFPITTTKFKTGTNVFDWIVPERCQEIAGNTICSMDELQIGEWVLKGARPDSILLCCYIDNNENTNLSGLSIALEVMESLAKTWGRKLTYRLAILTGTVGYAGYLSTIEDVNILRAIHLATAPFDSIAPGFNPVAKKKLSDLPFENFLSDMLPANINQNSLDESKAHLLAMLAK